MVQPGAAMGAAGMAVVVVIWEAGGKFCGCGHRLGACRGGESRQISARRSSLRRNVQLAVSRTSSRRHQTGVAAMACAAAHTRARTGTGSLSTARPGTRAWLVVRAELLVLHHCLISRGPKRVWCT